MFCEKCGSELNVEDKFCIHCGKSIDVPSFGLKSVGEKFPVFKFLMILGGLLLVIWFVAYVFITALDNTQNYAPPPVSDSQENVKPPEEINSSVLAEMSSTLEPLGRFTKPQLYDSDIDLTEWLSYIQYDSIDKVPVRSDTSRSQFANQTEVLSSVVKIVCEDGEYFYYGSGTNFADSGFVITNRHVIEDADPDTCMVGFPDADSGLINEVYWATPIIDKEDLTGHDLAVLSISEPVFDEELNIYGSYDRLLNNTFPTFEISNACSDSSATLGEDVFILGYPPLSGGALTITNGIISSLYSQDGYLVTSAKIVSGNSGGMAINRDGCYVGVPTAVYREFGSEQFGEIIDAEFVGEFITAVEDDLEEYSSQ